MKIPIIKYNDKFLNAVSWFGKVTGITLWPFIVLRENYKKLLRPEILINHESIHIKQQAEMLVIVFYIWYVLEWFIKLFKYGKRAYHNISFEREAYTNERDAEYLKNRSLYSWIKYL